MQKTLNKPMHGPISLKMNYFRPPFSLPANYNFKINHTNGSSVEQRIAAV